MSSNSSPYGTIYLKSFQTTPNPDIVNWLYRPVNAVDTIPGNVYITPSNQNSSVYVDQDIHAAGNIYNLSDVSKKENIEDIDADFLNKVIEDIRPRTYQFKKDSQKDIREDKKEEEQEEEKDDSAAPTHYGFIAQEVEQVLPELVSFTADTDENGNALKCVNYVEFIPLLLKKIQLMQKEIDVLREKVEGSSSIFPCFPC
jgi:hypothetical protein